MTQLTKSSHKKGKLIQDFPDVQLHRFLQSFVKTHENDEKLTYTVYLFSLIGGYRRKLVPRGDCAIIVCVPG